MEYNDTNILKIDYEKFLINIESKKIKDIIELYNKTIKITKCSDIYRYLKSKIDNKDEAEWPKEFKGITDKIKLKNSKCNFRKKCKPYFLGKNKRLYKQRTLNNPFDGKTYLLSSLILFEAVSIIKYFHDTLMHIGIRTLQFEIERRKLITLLKE